MKTRTKILAAVLSAAGILLLVFSLVFLLGSVRIPEGTEILLVSSEQGQQKSAKLSQQDAEVIRDILHGSVLYPEQLYCGFSDDFSLLVGERRLQVAEDGCLHIYDCQSEKYFSISEEERETILLLFEQYGLPSRKH